jgi:hypothetical protein
MDEIPKYKIVLTYKDDRFLHWKYRVFLHDDPKSYHHDREGYGDKCITWGTRRSKRGASRRGKRAVRKLIARDRRVSQRETFEIYVSSGGSDWSKADVELYKQYNHIMKPQNVEAKVQDHLIVELDDTPMTPRVLATLLRGAPGTGGEAVE